MKDVKLLGCCVAILVASLCAYFLATSGKAQTVSREIRPDISRALKTSIQRGTHTRANSYRPARPLQQQKLRQHSENDAVRKTASVIRDVLPPPSGPIAAGTALNRVLHTSQLSMTSTAGTNRAFVLMQYFGYLRRNPNDAPDGNFEGYDFWLNKLNQFGGDFRAAEMVKAFITSFEYQERFE